MTDEHDQPHAPAQSQPAAGSLSDHISQNIESVAELQKRERQSATASQRRLERVSRFVGRPLYLVGLLWFVALWIVVNSGAAFFGFAPFDPTPFQLLQGLLTLMALVTTTIVLIAQNRQTKLEQQQAHLDLQLNMLTEQKVTKLIHLLEELRRDLPMVKDRHDPQAALLQEGADTAQMVSALHDVGLTSDPEKKET